MTNYEKRLRAKPPESELLIRLERLEDMEHYASEQRAVRDEALPDSPEWRLADRSVLHLVDRMAYERSRISTLRGMVEEPPSRPEAPTMTEAEEDDARQLIEEADEVIAQTQADVHDGVHVDVNFEQRGRFFVGWIEHPLVHRSGGRPNVVIVRRNETYYAKLWGDPRLAEVQINGVTLTARHSNRRKSRFEIALTPAAVLAILPKFAREIGKEMNNRGDAG